MSAPRARLALWSTFFFLVPWALAWSLKLAALGSILTAVIAFSYLYHLRHGRLMRALDAAFAVLLMSAHLVLCVLGRFALPYFAFVVLFAPIAVFFYFRREGRDLNHALWHLFSAAVSVSAQLTFLHAAK